MFVLRFALVALLLSPALAWSAQLKIATVAPDGSAWMREMRAAGSEIKEATEGRVELKFYPGGVMGSDATVLRKIRVGQLQGGAFTGSELSLVYKDAQILGLPFLFRSQHEVAAVREVLDERLREGFAANGFVVPGIAGGGFAYLFSVHPIANARDLVASKVWVPQGDHVAQVTFNAAGVKPVALSIADVYPSLQTGLIDTVGNMPVGTIALQWHTRLKHMIDLPLAYVVGYLALDKRAVEKLDPQDRNVVEARIREAFERLDRINAQDNAGAFEALKKQGIAIRELSDEERAHWRSVGEKAIAELESRAHFSPDLLALIRERLASLRAGSPD